MSSSEPSSSARKKSPGRRSLFTRRSQVKADELTNDYTIPYASLLAPREPKSAYQHFVDRNRARVSSTYPALDAQSLTKRLTKEWHMLEADKRRAYELEAEEEERRHDDELAATRQPGAHLGQVRVTLSPIREGQHRVVWHEPIELKEYVIDGRPAVLQPGYCNLFKYPKTYFAALRQGKGIMPPPEALFVLERLLLALLTDTSDAGASKDADGPADFAHRLDASGARPHHGLLVANTPPSIDLVLEAFRRRPSLIALPHVGQPFEGENALHILAVNKHETELIELIDLAARELPPRQLARTFKAQAIGVFFHEEPMVFYGCTPIAYAVAFSLDGAISQMLRCSRDDANYPNFDNALIDLNAPGNACPLTGFHPLHVAVRASPPRPRVAPARPVPAPSSRALASRLRAPRSACAPLTAATRRDGRCSYAQVANSLTSMYNFLVDLPDLEIEFDCMRARPTICSQQAHFRQWGVLSPLQVRRPALASAPAPATR